VALDAGSGIEMLAHSTLVLLVSSLDERDLRDKGEEEDGLKGGGTQDRVDSRTRCIARSRTRGRVVGKMVTYPRRKKSWSDSERSLKQLDGDERTRRFEMARLGMRRRCQIDRAQWREYRSMDVLAVNNKPCFSDAAANFQKDAGGFGSGVRDSPMRAVSDILALRGKAEK